jgi:hypothetical protein
MPSIRLADIPNAGPQGVAPDSGIIAPRVAQLGGSAALDPNAMRGVAKDMQLEKYNLNAFAGEAIGMGKIGDAMSDVATLGIRFATKMADAKDDADFEKGRNLLAAAAQQQENDHQNLSPEEWGSNFDKLNKGVQTDIDKLGFSKSGRAKFEAYRSNWANQTALKITGMANKEKIEGYKQDAKIGVERELALGNEQGAFEIVNKFRTNGTLGERDAKDLEGHIIVRSINIAEQRQTDVVTADTLADWTKAKANLDQYKVEKVDEKTPDARIDGPYGEMRATKVKRLIAEVDRQGKYAEATNYNTLAQAIDSNTPVRLKNGSEILITDESMLGQATADIKVTDPSALKRLRLLVSDNVPYRPDAVSAVNARLANYDPSTDPKMTEFNAISNDIVSNVPKNLRSVMNNDLTSAWTKFSKDGTLNPKTKWQGEMISQINELGKNGVLGDMGTEKDSNDLFTGKIKDQTKYDTYWNKVYNLQSEMRDWFSDPANKGKSPEDARAYLNGRIRGPVQDAAMKDGARLKPESMRFSVPVGTGGLYNSPVPSPTPVNPTDLLKKSREIKAEGKVTSYNFKGDAYSDSNSRAGIGAWNNKLTENSLAISPDIESKFKAAGIGKGDPVELTLADGSTVIRNWDDRTMQDKQAIAKYGKPLTGRFDFHSPGGKQKNDGMAVLSFRKAPNA